MKVSLIVFSTFLAIAGTASAGRYGMPYGGAAVDAKTGKYIGETEKNLHKAPPPTATPINPPKPPENPATPPGVPVPYPNTGAPRPGPPMK